MNDSELIKKLDELIARQPIPEITVHVEFIKRTARISCLSAVVALVLLYCSQQWKRTEFTVGKFHFSEWGLS